MKIHWAVLENINTFRRDRINERLNDRGSITCYLPNSRKIENEMIVVPIKSREVCLSENRNQGSRMSLFWFKLQSYVT